MSLRWQYFSWFGLLAVNKNGSLAARDNPDKVVRTTLGKALNQIEGVLIAATEPAFNKQGAKFKGINHYLQVANPKADYVSPAELRDGLARIEKLISEGGA